MSRGLNVFVAIGAKLLPSLGNTASAVERRFGLMNRRIHAETKASIAGMQKNWGTFATHVSAPAGIAAGLGAKLAYDWAVAGNNIEAVAEMSAQARKEIEAVARSMPGNVVQNLSAALDLARTGFDANAIKATLPVTIKLAASDPLAVNQAEAADIMTNVMTGMGMGKGPIEQIARDAERVANNIAFGAAKSSSDVRLMGESFKYAAPLASRLGMNVEFLTATFMTMANAGIKGGEAGVALRSGMVRLLKPTKSAMAILAKYNMTLSDYVGQSHAPTGSAVVESLRAQGIAADAAKAKIDALIRNPDIGGADLVQKITEAVAEGFEGGVDAVDLDKISDGVALALSSGADKMNFEKFIADVRAKGWSTGDIVNFFDTRQGARLSTLFGEEFGQMRAMVNSAQGGRGGSFLDRMFATQNKGVVGSWSRIQQSFGTIFTKMAESGAMEAAASAMDRLAASVTALSKTNPAILKAITFGLVGLAVLAPIGFALAGIASGFGMLFSALSFGAAIALRFGSVIIGVMPRALNLMLAFFRTGIGRGLVGGAVRLLSGLGGVLMRVLGGMGPMLIRGLVAAFAYLSNPVGWVALVVTAGLIIWAFRKEIGAAWTKYVTPFFHNAWSGVKSYVGSINWSETGLKVINGIAYGLSFAWTTLKGWHTAAWTGLIGWIKGLNWSGAGSWVMSTLATSMFGGWGAIKAWWEGGWPGLIAWVKSLSWSDVGMFIADRLTFGLASKINGANWGGIIKGAIATGKSALDGWGAGAAAAGGAPAKPGAPAVAGKRAFGGPVRAGKTYLVGERGRELFTPNVGGSIIPNHKLPVDQPGSVRAAHGSSLPAPRPAPFRRSVAPSAPQAAAPAPTGRDAPLGSPSRRSPPLAFGAESGRGFVGSMRNVGAAIMAGGLVASPVAAAERPEHIDRSNSVGEVTVSVAASQLVEKIVPTLPAVAPATEAAHLPAGQRSAVTQSGRSVRVENFNVTINDARDPEAAWRDIHRRLIRLTETDGYLSD